MFLIVFLIYLFLFNAHFDDFLDIFDKNYISFVTDDFPSSALNNIIFWFKALTYTALPICLIAPSFRKNSFLRILMIFYVPFVAILNLVFINLVIYSYTGTLNLWYNLDSFSFFINAFLFTLMIYLSILFILDTNKSNNPLPKSVNDYLFSLFVVCVTFFAVIPTMGYALILGRSKIFFKPQSSFHILIILTTFILPFLFTYLFRKKAEGQKKIFLTWISICAFIAFFDYYTYRSFKNLSNWPLHLCHTAIIFLVIAIPFKVKSLFYFTYFVNVLGAFIALVFPNIGKETPIYSISSIRFWYNHMYDLIIPISAVGMGYFEKPKIKETMLSIVAFTGYFIFAVLANSLLPTVKNHPFFGNSGAGVDYFFLNGDILTKKISVAKILRDKYIITFKGFGGNQATVYYMFWFVLYFSFIILTFATLNVYSYLYSLNKIFTDISRKYRQRFKLKIDKLPKINEKELLNMQSNAIASIKIEKFYKKYPQANFYSVKDFNLNVKAGEIFGFIGHNGAGKSTLIKALVGVHPADEGRISICDYDMKLHPERAKYLVGYVPDNHPLYEKLTAREYIKYIANIYMVEPRLRDERIDYYIDLFDIRKDIDRQIKTFSHGMKQKISVIASLIHEPKVWILDEPLTGLDPTSVLMIKKCIIDHAKKGNIVFFSSHIIEVVENICTRIAIIKKGELMLDIDVKEAVSKYGNLTDVYKKYVLE